MANLLTTIPKSKFKTWALAERVLKRCDGETDWGDDGSDWLWFIRCQSLPTQNLINTVCYMVYDGRVRGYCHPLGMGEKPPPFRRPLQVNFFLFNCLIVSILHCI